MTRAAALFLALAPWVLLPGPAAASAGEDPPAPPAPAPVDDEAEKAAAEARDARERATKAAEEAAQAEKRALRAKRRTLERSIAAKEGELEKHLAAGDSKSAGEAEAELRRLYGEVASVASKLAMRVPPTTPAVAPRPMVPLPSRPFVPTEGLPPLTPSPVAADARAVVDAALDWLARHQATAGSWDGDGFQDRCADTRCPGPGGPLFDPGLTGLATLAFLGVGETHKTPRHGAVVREGLKYIKGIQDPEGCFGPRTSNHFVYNHALACLAMTEAYALTQSPLFKESAVAGVRHVLASRNPYLAWRYGVRPGDNDTSVTGWMVAVLRSAKSAGLEVDEEAFEGARTWLDKVTDPETGRVGYTARGNGPARPNDLIERFPPGKSESLTAAGVLSRLLCGVPADDPTVRKGLELLGRCLPRWDESAGTIDFYYWYTGTLASFRAGGRAWSDWREAVVAALGPNQRGAGDGCARGSWDPADPWGMDGGRVYSTAINALTTEVWLRYDATSERK